MTKLRDLESHLRAHGCVLLRQGANHSIWQNTATQKRTSVPRHREIPDTTATLVCKQLGIEPI